MVAAVCSAHRRPHRDLFITMQLQTVKQLESKHPALKGRLRRWINRADAGDPTFVGLRRALIRVGRSVFVDEPLFDAWLGARAAMPPASSRNSQRSL